MRESTQDQNIICPIEQAEGKYFCSNNDCCAFDDEKNQCLYWLVTQRHNIREKDGGSPDSLLSHRYNFPSIYNKHHKRIYSLNYNILKCKEDAEDITQETFTRAYRNLKNIDPKVPVFTWLCRVSINLCMDKFRKTKGFKFERLDTHLTSNLIEKKLTGLVAAIDMWQGIESEDYKYIIQEVLEELPPNYCQILMLRFCDNFCSKQIAEILNTTVSAVDTMLFRAKRRFKITYLNMLRKNA